MEGIINGTEDELVPGLRFGVPSGASYIVDRVNASAWPQGGSTFTPTGVGGNNLLRFQVSDPGMGFCDLSTIRLAGQLNNADGANPLRFPQQSIMSFVRRLRIMVAGTLVEDIMYSGRLAEQFVRCRPANRNFTDSTMGLGTSELRPAGAGGGGNYQNASVGFGRGWVSEDVPANGSRNFVSVIGPSGLLQTHYLLNLGRHPLTIEIELAPAADCTVQGAGLSATYSFTNLRVLFDVIHVNAAVLEQYNRLLEESPNGIPLHYSTYATTQHTITGTGDFAIMVQRAFSRIKDVWVTFSNNNYAQSAYWTEHNTFLSWHGRQAVAAEYGAPAPYRPAGDNFRTQLAIGPLVWPQYPASSHSELMYMAQKALALDSSVDGLSIPPVEWRGVSHFEVWDLEKSNGTPGSGLQAYTGVSTRDSGESIRLSWWGVTPKDADHTPSRAYVTLHVDCFLLLMKEGALVQD